MLRTAVFFAIFALTLTSVSCSRLQWRTRDIFNLSTEEAPVPQPLVAKKKHRRALILLDRRDYARAEQLLREALLADPGFFQAHNSLGKVYFDQKKFYLAAWEFESAARGMPGRAEPLNNLGLVMEATSKLDEAVEYYAQAWELAPESPIYLGNLLRAQIRRGDTVDELRPYFEELIVIDSRASWVTWAKKQLAFNPIEEIEMQEVFQPVDAQGTISDVLPDRPEIVPFGMESVEGLPVPDIQK